MSKSKIYLSWEDFNSHALSLCEQIKENYKGDIKGAVVITRGGLPLASVITAQFNIRNIETFALSSYGSGSERVSSIEEFSIPVEAFKDEGEGWIIIDDLIDTGNTAKYIKEKLPKGYLVALYSKNEEIEELDCYHKLFAKDSWICFPWSTYNFDD